MKGRFEIKHRLVGLREDLRLEKEKYSRMHQIDMQSGEGNTSREKIDMALGEITALEWVLDKEE